MKTFRHSILLILLLLVAPLALRKTWSSVRRLPLRTPRFRRHARPGGARAAGLSGEGSREIPLESVCASAHRGRSELCVEHAADFARSSEGALADRAVLYDIYSQARSLEASNKIPFQQAFTQAYRETVPKLSDRDAFTVTRWFGTPLNVLQEISSGSSTSIGQGKYPTAAGRRHHLDLPVVLRLSQFRPARRRTR